jgi:hypothetical protein
MGSETDTVRTHVSSVHHAVRIDEPTCTPRPVPCSTTPWIHLVRPDGRMHGPRALSAAVRACVHTCSPQNKAGSYLITRPTH